MFLRRLARPFVWTSVGAAIAYFCDPENGRGRRARTKDQVGARFRDARETAEQKARYVQNTAGGKAEGIRRSEDTPPEDDRTLVDKIKSEVLGGGQFQGHQVVVDAVNGVVTLRGQVAEANQAEQLVKAVERVPGVRSVENLVHGPEEPAPNKQASVNASAG